MREGGLSAPFVWFFSGALSFLLVSACGALVDSLSVFFILFALFPCFPAVSVLGWDRRSD